MNKFRVKHDVLSHIPDTAFSAVIEGMSDVVKFGTARIAQIPGIEVCAKTGTAETYTILDGKRIKLPNNSMFVCFAPKENPKIAIATFVQNAGFGSTWAGPISRILIEKYLNDTLQTKSVADVERISNADLMPAYFKRLQFKTDSLRAIEWFQKTNDSSYLEKYIKVQPRRVPAPGDSHPDNKPGKKLLIADLPNKKKVNRPGGEVSE
jgi:penicillin-binding protein 2